MLLRQLVASTVTMLLVSAMFAQSRPAVEQRWAAGKYAVVLKSVTSQSGRKEGPSSFEVEQRYELVVQKPDAKGQKVRVVFNRLTLRAKAGGIEELQYDTDKPAGENRQSPQFVSKAMIGRAMDAIIGTDGKVGEISGLDEIVKEAGAGDNPVAARKIVRRCKEEVTAAVERLLFHYPEGPVVKGYAWTRNDPMDLGPLGFLKMTQTYTVKGVEDTPDGKVADIEFIARNTSDKPVTTDANTAKLMQLAPLEEVTHGIAGTIKVNLGTRMLVSEKLHTKKTMKGTSLMDGGKVPFNLITEGNSEVVVTPAKNAPTSSTRPGSR